MIERRFFSGAQVRTAGDNTIEGYGAVFNQNYDNGWFIETIKPGAFSRVLASNPDVRGLFNHNPDHVLGRTKNKTLTLVQDEVGLRFTNKMPKTPRADEVYALVDRGDIDGCSFSFIAAKQTWREEKDPNDAKRIIRYRDIEEFDQIFDVGPVTFPAYTGTSVAARQQSRGRLWPEGVPAEIRSHVPGLRADAPADAPNDPEPDGDGDMLTECKCRCRACYSAECNECGIYMPSCGDGERCGHMAGDERNARAKDGKKTKRVDGEDLPSPAFLYVGDPEKTATWSLPWKFSTDDKTKSHLRNGLARFNQTSNIPADDKPKVWKKLVAKCTKYGIHVSDDESKSWGFTAEQREQIGSGDDCQCDCPECQVGNHDECSEPGCDDPNCNHDVGDTINDDDRAAARTLAAVADAEFDLTDKF